MTIVAVGTAVLVAVAVSVSVGDAVGAAVAVDVGVLVTVAVGVAVLVGVDVLVGVGAGSAARIVRHTLTFVRFPWTFLVTSLHCFFAGGACTDRAALAPDWGHSSAATRSPRATNSEARRMMTFPVVGLRKSR